MSARWACPGCGFAVRLDDNEFPFTCPNCATVATTRQTAIHGPGLVRRALNLGRSVARGIAAGAFQVPAEIVAERLAICQGCEQYFDPDSQTCKHPECGCRVRAKGLLNKLAWSHERCPIRRWDSR